MMEFEVSDEGMLWSLFSIFFLGNMWKLTTEILYYFQEKFFA